MRIAVDFDGTICNTNIPQQVFCRQEYGIVLPIETSVGSLRKKYLTAEQVAASKLFLQGDVTFSAPLVPGACEALQQLAGEGHRIAVLTNRQKIGAVTAKEYMRRNNIPYDNFLFMSGDDKRKLSDGTPLTKRLVLERLHFDVMIEDQAKGLKELGAVSGILLDQPWNTHEKLPVGTIRLRSWREIIRFIQVLSRKGG